MILDKLLEKKDVLAYIEYRIIQINSIDVKKQDYKKREFIKQRNYGRILELQQLKKKINKLKQESISISRKQNNGRCE